MVFTTEAQLAGDATIYQISPQIKKYALLDTGFIQQKNGSYQLQRQLETGKSFAASFKLKIVVNQDLSGFKMKVINANGTSIVNIFTHQKAADLTEQFNYFINELVRWEILVRK